MIVKIALLAALLAVAWMMWRRGRAPLRIGSMPPSEARALLGIAEKASPEQIREAHRRLIARVHPDSGGSPELAMRVNAARDVLLAELNRRAS